MAEPARSLPVEDAACLFCESAPAEPLARGRDCEYATTPDVFDLMRCAGCGLVFLRPRPAPAAMPIIYPRNYYAYREEEAERPFVKFFRDRIERVKVRRYEALIGSGPASLVDVDCGDFETLSLEGWEGRFDCAMLPHVIEHTRRPREALVRLRSLLRPDGVSGFGARPFDYLLFYVLPAVTVFLFLARLRMYLEHGPLDYAVSDHLGENRRLRRTWNIAPSA